MKLTNKTRLNMIIGYPLEHSQSALLHNSVYQMLGINAVFMGRSHLKLKSLIHAIKTLSIELTAVTLPYKEKIIKFVDQCSQEVKILKAANTIIQDNRKLKAYNTDSDGIAFALKNTVLKQKTVLVLGAGGAARALGYFLNKNKAKIFWLNRTPKKAYALAMEFGGNVISRHELSTISIDVIINTTSLGLYPNVNISPLPDYVFRAQQTVFDMVYHPMTTRLLHQASEQKAKTISGIEMFIGQGLKQIELLIGKPLHSPKMISQLRKILIADQRATQK